MISKEMTNNVAAVMLVMLAVVTLLSLWNN